MVRLYRGFPLITRFLCITIWQIIVLLRNIFYLFLFALSLAFSVSSHCLCVALGLGLGFVFAFVSNRLPPSSLSSSVPSIPLR